MSNLSCSWGFHPASWSLSKAGSFVDVSVVPSVEVVQTEPTADPEALGLDKVPGEGFFIPFPPGCSVGEWSLQSPPKVIGEVIH